MKLHSFVLTALLTLFLVSCSVIPQLKIKNSLVQIETPNGKILIKLYEETPLHSNNFLLLAQRKYFDGTLFHRVIDGFMIQGGDPESKDAPAGTELGEGGPGYDIPAEIRDGLIHKRGVIAAARESDIVNPQRASSGSQFYIVQGKVYTDPMLDAVEMRKWNEAKDSLLRILLKNPDFAEINARMEQAWKDGNKPAYDQAKAEAEKLGKADIDLLKPYKLTAEQRRVYKTEGGAAHLDGSYTVFGEVVDGMVVVDAIAKMPRDNRDRPLTNIPMTITVKNANK